MRRPVQPRNVFRVKGQIEERAQILALRVRRSWGQGGIRLKRLVEQRSLVDANPGAVALVVTYFRKLPRQVNC